MPLPNSALYKNQQHVPSCYERMKYGFKVGFCVGVLSMGLLGGFHALRLGLRGHELMSNVGKMMIQGGGSFGAFMAIGTGLRC